MATLGSPPTPPASPTGVLKAVVACPALALDGASGLGERDGAQRQVPPGDESNLIPMVTHDVLFLWRAAGDSPAVS